MKRLKEQPGGMPLHIGDFTFLQDGIKEAIAGQLFDKNCVLKGCDLTTQNSGQDFHISEGWVYIDGEVYHVPDHVVKDNDGSGNKSYDANNFNISSHADLGSNSFLENFFFEEQVDYDSQGNDTFHDSTNRDTYEIRTMKGVHFVAGQNQNVPGDANYLSIAGRMREEVLMDREKPFIDLPEFSGGRDGFVTGALREYSYKYVSFNSINDPGGIYQYKVADGQDVPINTNNGWAFTSGFEPEIRQEVVGATNDTGGTVRLTGRLDSGNATDPKWHDGSALASNMKPSRTKQIPITETSSSASSPSQTAILVVNTDGSMEVYASSFGSGIIFTLDGVSWDP